MIGHGHLFVGGSSPPSPRLALMDPTDSSAGGLGEKGGDKSPGRRRCLLESHDEGGRHDRRRQVPAP